jgi:hypothetical protein
MIRLTAFDDSLVPTAFLSWSPNTIVTSLGPLLTTQCAADITHFGWMSEPPQNENVPWRREACHFHSHSVAIWPFTIFPATSPFGGHGVLSTPLRPQFRIGGGVVGGPGVVVVTVWAQSFQPFCETE